MKTRIVLKSFDELFLPMFPVEEQSTPCPAPMAWAQDSKPSADRLSGAATDRRSPSLFNPNAHEEKSSGGGR
jgi:hypothetical protein